MPEESSVTAPKRFFALLRMTSARCRATLRPEHPAPGCRIVTSPPHRPKRAARGEPPNVTIIHHEPQFVNPLFSQNVKNFLQRHGGYAQGLPLVRQKTGASLCFREEGENLFSLSSIQILFYFFSLSFRRDPGATHRRTVADSSPMPRRSIAQKRRAGSPALLGQSL